MSNETVKIELCLGSSCYSKGSDKIVEKLEQKIADGEFNAEIKLKGCLCADKCTDGPIVKINDTLYTNVSTSNIVKLVQDNIKE